MHPSMNENAPAMQKKVQVAVERLRDEKFVTGSPTITARKLLAGSLKAMAGEEDGRGMRPAALLKSASCSNLPEI